MIHVLVFCMCNSELLLEVRGFRRLLGIYCRNKHCDAVGYKSVGIVVSYVGHGMSWFSSKNSECKMRVKQFTLQFVY